MANPGASNVEGVDLDGMKAYLGDTDVRFAVTFWSRVRGAV